MTTSPPETPKTPWYQSRWFWLLALAMFGLRLGYKYWRQEQRPDPATRMEQLTERSEALKARIQANQDSQRAAGRQPVLAAPADTAVLADTAAVSR